MVFDWYWAWLSHIVWGPIRLSILWNEGIEYLPYIRLTAPVCHSLNQIPCRLGKNAFNVGFIESWKSWNVKIETSRSSHRLLRDLFSSALAEKMKFCIIVNVWKCLQFVNFVCFCKIWIIFGCSLLNQFFLSYPVCGTRFNGRYGSLLAGFCL